jgi:NTE family protein
VAQPIKRALVLSAGGMFGAYQAGAWDILNDLFQPDLVVGASIGSLNGYLIACGLEPGELVERWLSLEDLTRLRWHPSMRLTRGQVDATLLENWLQEMCSHTPHCEYALVATETLTCKQRIFQSPELSWVHLAASCAIPLFLPVYRIDGTCYSDGGLVDPLPLAAAQELGATEIVAINVMHRRPLAVRAAVGLLRSYARYRRPNRGAANIIEIHPSQPLGGIRDSVVWNRRKAEEWIELGRKDAKACAGLFAKTTLSSL